MLYAGRAGRSRVTMVLPFRILLILCMISFPLIVYLGLQGGWDKALGYALIGLGVFRAVLALVAHQKPKSEIAMAVPLIALGSAAIALNNAELLFLYPVMMSFGLCSVFALSLRFPPPLIERLARLKEPDLPPFAVQYCRKVTWVWTVFLMINGMIALSTVLYGDQETWALYNGLISYILMGLLFVGEMLIRQRVRQS